MAAHSSRTRPSPDRRRRELRNRRPPAHSPPRGSSGSPRRTGGSRTWTNPARPPAPPPRRSRRRGTRTRRPARPRRRSRVQSALPELASASLHSISRAILVLFYCLETEEFYSYEYSYTVQEDEQWTEPTLITLTDEHEEELWGAEAEQRALGAEGQSDEADAREEHRVGRLQERERHAEREARALGAAAARQPQSAQRARRSLARRGHRYWTIICGLYIESGTVAYCTSITKSNRTIVVLFSY